MRGFSEERCLTAFGIGMLLVWEPTSSARLATLCYMLLTVFQRVILCTGPQASAPARFWTAIVRSRWLSFSPLPQGM